MPTVSEWQKGVAYTVDWITFSLLKFEHAAWTKVVNLRL